MRPSKTTASFCLSTEKSTRSHCPKYKHFLLSRLTWVMVTSLPVTGLAKKFPQAFHYMLWKHPKELLKKYLSSSVQLLSRVRLFATPWTTACQCSLSITSSWSLLKCMPIELVMPSDHLILCCPLFLLPSIFPSIRAFLYESVLYIRWPKYWSFSFSISPSNEYSGLITFQMDLGSPCSPRDSQESSPTPQFKSINSSALLGW